MSIRYFTNILGVVMVFALATPALASHPDGIRVKTEARAAQLKNRLAEIKALDRSQLSAKEKKALRMEVKGIKKELSTMAGGVYLSVGAVILIVLLLILLL